MKQYEYSGEDSKSDIIRDCISALGGKILHIKNIQCYFFLIKRKSSKCLLKKEIEIFKKKSKNKN